MAGYTPLYDSMLTGTLYGRWPHTGIWACLLSRASREGVIDEVPASLAAAIGVPVDLLMQCIDDFMKPDPGSRTKDHEGRRLELLDPNRDWGWVVLNHGKYREKARKKNYDEQRTVSGADAERKKIERTSREVPTCPDVSRAVPLSEAEAYKNKKERSSRLPSDFSLTPNRRVIAEQEQLDPERTFANFCDYWRAIPGSKGTKLDWDATWRVWCRNDKGAKKKQERGLVA
jgi:hypothetical protein